MTGRLERVEDKISKALAEYRWGAVQHNELLPYDVNPVIAVEHPCRPKAVVGVFRFYRAMGCAAVYRNERLWTIGREINVNRAVDVVRSGHSLEEKFPRMVKWCMQGYCWDVQPTRAQYVDYRQLERTAWKIVELFPKLRDKRYPAAPVLLPHGGHYKLGGMLTGWSEKLIKEAKG